MAKGKKYSDEIREAAYALLATGDNVQAVAEKLNLPYTTVKTWYDRWIKTDSKNDEKEENLVEVRNLQKKRFVNKAWDIIINSANLAERKVSRALYLEEKIDAVADAISKHSEALCRESGATWDELVGLVKELKNFKAVRLGELSSLIASVYDRQCLITREPTSIIEAKRFEDF